MRALLLSDETEAMLRGRADNVKSAAEGAHVEVNDHHGGRVEMPYEVEVDRSDTRVRVRVVADHPAGLRAEVKYRTLGTATDAAR